eukprot:CAMPEP_0116141114 /NCGR_PEP_ID=MMETSP0329-20121206/14210_1 /TAXON_ID=697910 /ORGANISM="Pseudo-nitzschia arenysensis, Strain B593" /LENGTH=372 /DNA_ID=CAMNT_0003636277 /DNA_START=122 /DNA_END=1240 /DNA_ORIENTATION=+
MEIHAPYLAGFGVIAAYRFFQSRQLAADEQLQNLRRRMREAEEPLERRKRRRGTREAEGLLERRQRRRVELEVANDEEENEDQIEDPDKYERQLARSWRWNHPEITSFSGRREDWDTWRFRTEVILNGMGFGRILRDRVAALRRRARNSMLFSLLFVALQGGTMGHLHMDRYAAQDGHQLWHDLIRWYEANGQLFYRLMATRLVPGVRVDEYVHRFQIIFQRLQAQEDFRITPANAKIIFVQNIQDPQYESIARALEAHIHMRDCTLDEMISHLVTHVATRLNRDIYTRNSKPRRVSYGTQPLTGELPLSQYGRISVANKVWRAYSKEAQDFIRTYNKRVRSHQPVPKFPKGVTLGPVNRTETRKFRKLHSI